MQAAANGHTDIIDILLTGGASIEAKTDVRKRMFICPCVFGEGGGGILPSYCVISEKYHIIL